MYFPHILIVIVIFLQHAEGSNECAKHFRYYDSCIWHYVHKTGRATYNCYDHLMDYVECNDKQKKQMKMSLDNTKRQVHRLNVKVQKQETVLKQFQRKAAKEMKQIKRGQGRLQHQHTILRSRLEKFRCQVGTFSFYRFPKVPSYPRRKTFKFSPPFEKKPAVIATVRMLDNNSKKNLLFRVNTSGVTSRGFTMTVTNYHKGLYGADAVWMACPS